MVDLKPASERRLASEPRETADGAMRWTDRAQALLERDDDQSWRLARHLIETTWLDAPGDEAIQMVDQQVIRALADAASSTMARGVFYLAVRESRGETL